MSEVHQFAGDIFWDDADTENSVDSPEDALDNVGPLAIIEFQQAKRLPNFFGVAIPRDSAHDDYRFFSTKAEAAACIAQHSEKEK